MKQPLLTGCLFERDGEHPSSWLEQEPQVEDGGEKVGHGGSKITSHQAELQEGRHTEMDQGWV